VGHVSPEIGTFFPLNNDGRGQQSGLTCGSNSENPKDFTAENAEIAEEEGNCEWNGGMRSFVSGEKDFTAENAEATEEELNLREKGNVIVPPDGMASPKLWDGHMRCWQKSQKYRISGIARRVKRGKVSGKPPVYRERQKEVHINDTSSFSYPT
jgi:hypothetical protein